jgi:hypothetical protein
LSKQIPAHTRLSATYPIRPHPSKDPPCFSAQSSCICSYLGLRDSEDQRRACTPPCVFLPQQGASRRSQRARKRVRNYQRFPFAGPTIGFIGSYKNPIRVLPVKPIALRSNFPVSPTQAVEKSARSAQPHAQPDSPSHERFLWKFRRSRLCLLRGFSRGWMLPATLSGHESAC